MARIALLVAVVVAVSHQVSGRLWANKKKSPDTLTSGRNFASDAPSREEAGVHKAHEVVPLGEGGFKLTITRPGNGQLFPRDGDKVLVNYTGTLSRGGRKFDSSRDRGEAFEFIIGEGKVITGWDEGIEKMSLGERGILHVPSYKGYGSSGTRDGNIPPDSDLDFDIELLAVNGVEVPGLPKKPTPPPPVLHKSRAQRSSALVAFAAVAIAASALI